MVAPSYRGISGWSPAPSGSAAEAGPPGTAWLTVTKWRFKVTDDPYWPFTQQEGPRDCEAGPNNGNCMITLTVADQGPNGRTGAWVFLYDMLVNDQPADPEMIIEWF